MKKLLAILKKLIDIFNKPPMPPNPPPYVPPTPVPPPVPVVTPTERLHTIAVSCLGRDVTPDDAVDDEVDCADTVNTIYQLAFGHKMVLPGISTTQLHAFMVSHPELFRPVLEPGAGNIIISPTGKGNGNLSHGHCGIFYNEKDIMSNSSANGTFQRNYTLDAWVKRYRNIGGYPIYIFERI